MGSFLIDLSQLGAHVGGSGAWPGPKSGTKPQGLFKTDPPFCPSQLKFFFKHLFSQKIDLLHVSDASESIWAKKNFWIFWWNTRLRLTMGAIPYIHFLNPLMFCITGYKWTSLPSMVISEWLVCPLLCSKDDTFRKNPEILWFSANLGVVPHVQFFEIKFLT